MYRSIVLGAFVLLAVPLAQVQITALVDQMAVDAEFDDFSASLAGITAGRISADPARREVAIEGVVLRRPDLSLRIGRLTLHLGPRVPYGGLMQAAAATKMPARTAKPDTISADDVAIDTPGLHARIKHIDMIGTKLGRAEFNALFDAHAPGSAAERLAKVSAARIVMTEVTLESTPAATKSEIPAPAPGAGAKPPVATARGAAWDTKITLSDIGLNGVQQGRVAAATVGATSSIVRTDAGAIQLAFGPLRAEGLDLVEFARLLSVGTPDMRHTLCDNIDVTGVKMTAPKAEIGFATLAVKDVKSGSLQELLTSGDHLGAAAKSAPAFAGLAQKIDIGAIDYTDLRFSSMNGTASWAGRIDKGFLTRHRQSDTTDAGFDNLTVTAQGAKVTVGHLSWHDAPVAESGAEKLLPNRIGPPQETTRAEQESVAAERLDIDLGAVDLHQASQAAPTHFQLAHFEATGSKASDGVLTRMQAAFDHLTFNIEGLKTGDFAQVAALGYGKLDLSSRLAAHFDEDTGTFGLDALSLSGPDVGSVQISGRFDHVTKALFSTDQADMEAGILALLLRRLEVKLVNAGLFERLIAAEAKSEQTTPAAIRKKYADAAAHDLPRLLNNGRGADKIAAALAKFIAAPKNLRLAVAAPDGLAALQLILVKDPAVLLQKLDIDAAADE